MDADTAPEITFADGAAASDGHLAAPLRVRWRQRAIGRCRAAAGGAADTARSTTAGPHASPPAPALAADRAFVAPDAGRDLPAELARRDAGPGDPNGDGSQGDGPTRAGREGEPGHADEIGKTRAIAGRWCTGDVAAASGIGACGRRDVGAVDGPGRHSGEPAPPGSVRAARDAVPARDADTGHRNTVDDVGVEPPGDASSEPEAEPGVAPAAHGTDTAPSADSQRAPRDIELRLLARRAQGAALQVDFDLRTALARQVFRRDFVYVSRQVHALEASRRVQGLDRARLDDALATLRQRADAIQAFMAQRATALQAAIDARGAASARIAFARPARFEATIVSPGAHRFLELLLQADETLARLEMAWLLGLVEPASRSALVRDCRRALLGFKDLACDLRRAVGLLVQEINAQRREGGTTRDAP